jgi:hypothetical protein
MAAGFWVVSEDKYGRVSEADLFTTHLTNKHVELDFYSRRGTFLLLWLKIHLLETQIHMSIVFGGGEVIGKQGGDEGGVLMMTY